MTFGHGLNRSSWKMLHPNPPAENAPTGGEPWTAFSSACAAAASGTNCPRSLATTAPCTAGSKGGVKTASSAASGPCWSSTAPNWTRCTGSGRVPTGPWARLGSGGKKVGHNPTDRGKNGTKRSLLVDEQGGPLGLVIDGANRHDTKLLHATIAAIVVERPRPTAEQPQHLCLDKAYDNPTGHETVAATGYTGHIRQIGAEKLAAGQGEARHKPRRWVVERTLAWLSKCRAILVRYDKHDFNYLGLVQLACSLFWYRRLRRLKTA